MKHILRDNAAMAWIMAIKYCEHIRKGRVTLAYRKSFIIMLHNAVELYIKQYMLDTNQKKVITVKSKDREFENAYCHATDLNEFFYDYYEKKGNKVKIYSCKFCDLLKIGKNLFAEELKEDNGEKIFESGMQILEKLRNDETHFYINAKEFLCDSEFTKLYNFMIVFYKILAYYKLLPFWGKCHSRCEYSRMCFEREFLEEFSYKEALRNSSFVTAIKRKIDGKVFLDNTGTDAYSLTCEIADECEVHSEEEFEELWIYIEGLCDYNLIQIIEDYEEEEIIDGDRVFYQKVPIRRFIFR